MQQPLDRRNFLRRTAAYTGGTLLAPSLAGLIACNDGATAPGMAPAASPSLKKAPKGAGGYGDLQADPGGLPFLIPAGFQMVQLSEAGALLARGTGVVPNALDGMGAFRGKGHKRVRLVRNHEIRDIAANVVPIGTAGKLYDPKAGGGTTTLEIELDHKGVPRLVDEFVSLGGTAVNCAGGITPWGSWLTCEETVEGTPPRIDRRTGRETGGNRGKKHGYVFEVPADADDEVAAYPIEAMGRFSHEAVAIDKQFGDVYETEDAGTTSGFYRYVPQRRRELGAGGRLQMLAVRGVPRADTTNQDVDPANALNPEAGRPYAAHWVDVDDVDPNLEGGAASVFAQGLAAGGARFARLEGCWYGDNSVFFNSTSGGRAGAGQVWQYRATGPDAGELVLVFESPSRAVLESPDNLCVSPRGGLVLCEDGRGTQYLRGLTQAGTIFDFVRAADPDDATEFAGACFSPDGDVMFFNTQGSTSRTGTERGGTFAIWGDWKAGAL